MDLKEHSELNLERYIDSTAEMNEVGEQLIEFFSTIAEFVEHHLPTWLPKGLHVGEVVSSALGFLTVPLLYLSSFIANEKVPFNLNNNSRWLYSAVVLGLTIAGFVVPGVAPILAVTVAGLSFGVASFVLAKTVRKWLEERKEHKIHREQLPLLTKEHELLEDEIHTVQAQLSLASEEEKESLQNVLNQLMESLHSNESALRKIEETQQAHSHGLTKIMDKSAGVLFASIAVVGFALAVAIPPVGLMVLIPTLASSLTYTIGRLVFEGIERLRHKGTESAAANAGEVVEASISEKQASQATSTLEETTKNSLNHSTINMMNALHANVSPKANIDVHAMHAAKSRGRAMFSPENGIPNSNEDIAHPTSHQ